MEALAKLALLVLLILGHRSLALAEDDPCVYLTVRDIPVASDFTFSKLTGGIWHLVRATNTVMKMKIPPSTVVKYIEGSDGTKLNIFSGYNAAEKKCSDGVLTKFEEGDTPGSYRVTTPGRGKGLGKFVAITETAFMMYACAQDNEDEPCSEENKRVVIASRHQSVSDSDQAYFNSKLDDICIRKSDFNQYTTGQCSIPYVSTNYITESIFAGGIPVVNIHINKGDPLLLKCSMPVAVKLKWVKMTPKSRMLTSENRRVIGDSRISVQRPFLKDWNLKIRDTTVKDEGVYVCLDYNKKIIRYVVTVIQPPVFLASQELFQARADISVMLRCPVEGNPPPTVSWFWRNQYTKEEHRCGDALYDIIFIVETSKNFGARLFRLAQDFLRYFLIPANLDKNRVKVGILTFSDETHVEFNLDAFKDKVNIYHAIDSLRFESGNGSQLSDAIHIARTEMLSQANGARANVDKAIFVITNGVAGTDFAQAMGEASKARESGTHVYVVYGSNENIGDVDELASKPVKQHIFTLGRFEQLRDFRNHFYHSYCPEPEGEILTFTSITKADLGHYVCYATSSIAGAVSKTFFLDVEFSPEVTVKPSKVAMSQGQTLVFNCKVKASPASNITWYHELEEITADDRHTLTVNSVKEYATHISSLVIKNLKDSDFGTYTCIGRNTEGTASGTAQLLEAIRYDVCDTTRDAVEEDFDYWNILGEWQRIKALSYRYGNNTYDSKTIRFFINEGGYPSVTYYGKFPYADECHSPNSYSLLERSPGRYHLVEGNKKQIYNFIYCDDRHAIVFLCRSLDANGHCPKENVHVEIYARKFPVPEKIMTQLELIVKNLCVDVDDMMSTTPGLCHFSNDFLDSVGYGPGGVNQQYLCNIERTRVQRRFDADKFLGLWHNIKTTTFRHGDNTPTSETLQFFRRADGQLALAVRTFGPFGQSCAAPFYMDLEETRAGKYKIRAPDNTTDGSIQVVHTDYRYAVFLSCSNVQSNRLCAPAHINVQIIARQYPVPDSVMVELEEYVRLMCINVSKMLIQVPGQCDVPLSYLGELGSSEAESCQVDHMKIQNNFDKNRFLGKWNIIQSSPIKYGEHQYLTALQQFFLTETGTFSTAHRGFIKELGSCLKPGVVAFHKDDHGDYVFNSLEGEGMFKVLYTDYEYAVTYSCRITGPDGKCIKGMNHASILSRYEHVTAGMLKKLRRYVHNSCVDTDRLLSGSPGLCTISEEFLQTVGYTDSGRCQVMNIPTQSNFDINHFLGKWKALKAFKDFNNGEVFMSVTKKFFMTENSELKRAFIGYDPRKDQCIDGEVTTMETIVPGHYLIYNRTVYKIVYTDYENAIVFMCLEIMSDGHCLRGKTMVVIMSRHDSIASSVMKVLKEKLLGICVDPSDLKDLKTDLCLISPDFMSAAGYDGPPEGKNNECQVSVIKTHSSSNLEEQVAGDWYVEKFTDGFEKSRKWSRSTLHISSYDTHLQFIGRTLNEDTGYCNPTSAIKLEKRIPGNYFQNGSTPGASYKVMYLDSKYLVIHMCLKEDKMGMCAKGQGRMSISSRSGVMPPDDLVKLKKYIVQGCFDSNKLIDATEGHCPVPSGVANMLAVNLIEENFATLGCETEYVHVQPEFDITKFGDTSWNVLYRSASSWEDPAKVPSIQKQVIVASEQDGKSCIFLLSRSYRESWKSCEPVEILRLFDTDQPGNYGIEFEEDGEMHGLFRVMYMDEEYAVTFTCLDMSEDRCPKDSLMVEILSTHTQIEEDQLHKLMKYVNDACVDVTTMVQTKPGVCSIPEEIVLAVHDNKVTTNYAMPLVGSDGLIEVDPSFDTTMLNGDWISAYSTNYMPWQAGASAVSVYFTESESGIVLVRTIYLAHVEQCLPTTVGAMLERSGPGDYATLLEHNMLILKFLHIEETAAVSYGCTKVQEDGHCAREASVVNFFSRNGSMTEETLARLKTYMKGTGSEPDDVIKLYPGPCEISDKIKAAADELTVQSSYTFLGCSKDFIPAVQVTIADLEGEWFTIARNLYPDEPPFEAETNHVVSYGDGTTGVWFYRTYGDGKCRPTESFKFTETERGTYTVRFVFSTGIMKVLHKSETEIVLYFCMKFNEDGTCKKGSSALEIMSRQRQIDANRLNKLKTFATIVCDKADDTVRGYSKCVIPESFIQGARDGKLTQDYTVPVSGCDGNFLQVDPSFNVSKIAGDWNVGFTLSRLHWMSQRPTSQSFFFHPIPFGMAVARKVHSSVEDSCVPATLGIMFALDEPGSFFLYLPQGKMVVKVLHLGEDEAVIFLCSLVMDDGRCHKDHITVNFLFRDQKVSYEKFERLKHYVTGTCASTANVKRMIPGMCDISEKVKARVHLAKVSDDFSRIECSMDYIAAQPVTFSELAGSWHILATKDLTDYGYFGKYIDSVMIFIVPYDGGEDKAITFSRYHSFGKCLQVKYGQLNLIQPGTFTATFNNLAVTIKVLYVDASESVWYFCAKQKADGTCVKGASFFEIWSRRGTISKTRLDELKKYAVSVCDEAPTTILKQSPCTIPDTFLAAASYGDLTQASGAPIDGCSMDFITPQPDFDESKLLGDWNVLYITQSEAWSRDVSSVLLHFAAKSVIKVVDSKKTGLCAPAKLSFLNPVGPPGDYELLAPNDLYSYKFLYLDDEVVVVYLCSELGQFGTCSKNTVYVAAHGGHIPPSKIATVKQALDGTCVVFEQMVKLSVGLCEIDEGMKAEVAELAVQEHTVLGCKLKYLPTQDVTFEQLKGQWHSVVRMQFPDEVDLQGDVAYFVPEEDSEDGTLFFVSSFAGKCMLASAMKMTMTKPGTFKLLYKTGRLSEVNVLYLEEELVLHFCAGLKGDGYCQEDQSSFEIYSRTGVVSEEKLNQLKKLAGSVCMEADDNIYPVSPCSVPEVFIEGARSGTITQGYSIPVYGGDSNLIVPTPVFDLSMILGKWNMLYTDSYQPWKVTGASADTYHSRSMGGFRILHRRYNVKTGYCDPVQTIRLQQNGRSGEFTHQLPTFVLLAKFLHVDDTSALFYACSLLEGGSCKKENTIINVFSRNTEFSDDKFDELKLKIKRIGTEPEDMVKFTTGLCDIPKYLKAAADRQELPDELAQISCWEKYIPVQTDFDIKQFSGTWYTISKTTFIWGENSWIHSLRHIEETSDNRIALLTRGYSPVDGGCEPTELSFIHPTDTPGEYYFSNGDDNVTMKVVHTDYTHAVLYFCLDHDENRNCKRDKLQLEMLSKNPEIDSETRKNLTQIMVDACIKVEEIHQSTPGQCPIAPHILQAVIAGQVEADNVKLNCMDRFVQPQKNFDIKKFAGGWKGTNLFMHMAASQSWDSPAFNITVFDDMTIGIGFQGYSKMNSTCLEPWYTNMIERGQPGDYRFDNHGDEDVIKILYTNYNIAVVYFCKEFEENSVCKNSVVGVEIWSRVGHVSDVTLKSFFSYIEDSCAKFTDTKELTQDLCEVPVINFDELHRLKCTIDDIHPTPEFILLQMPGLWYEVARTRFTFNKLESISVFYTQDGIDSLEGLFTGSLNGFCQDPLSSITKLKDLQGSHSSLLGRLGGKDSIHSWAEFKILHYDGRYMMVYGCYQFAEDGTCLRERTEITLMGRVNYMDDDVKARIPRLMHNVCLHPQDLVRSVASVDCTDRLVGHRKQTPSDFRLLRGSWLFKEISMIHKIMGNMIECQNIPAADEMKKCSPIDRIPVAENIRQDELVGDWQGAAGFGFGPEGHDYKYAVNIKPLVETSLRMEVSQSNANGHVANYSMILKSRCPHGNYGDFISSLGSTLFRQWSSLKIVHRDSESVLMYWCLNELSDGTCHPSGVRVLLLSSQPMLPFRKDELLGLINDVCVPMSKLEPEEPIVVRVASIPGAVIGWDEPSLFSRKLRSDSCALTNLPTINFDQERMSGAWYEIMHTPDPMWTMTSTVIYHHAVGNGKMMMHYSGTNSQGQCLIPFSADMRPRCPKSPDGDYEGRINRLQTKLWSTFKVMYTDYEQAALIMSCMDEDEEGHCTPNGTKVHILSRTHDLSDDLLNKLNMIIRMACIDESKLRTTFHEGDCAAELEEYVSNLRKDMATLQPPPK